MSSKLAGIQQEVADTLSADPYFEDIDIVTERLKDIDSIVAQALATLGIAVIVATPVANVRNPNHAGPFFDEVNILCRVIENVVINVDTENGGSGKAALEVCEKICGLLHQFKTVSSNGPVLCATPTIMLVADPGLLVYDVKFTTTAETSYIPPKVETPTLALDAGTLTLACATANANIFYTEDGKQPSPRVGTLYTGPFTPTGDPADVKARAWLAGYLTSDVGRL